MGGGEGIGEGRGHSSDPGRRTQPTGASHHSRHSGDSRKFYMGWQKGGKLNSRVANHIHKVKSSLFIVGNTHAWCLYVFIYTNR